MVRGATPEQRRKVDQALLVAGQQHATRSSAGRAKTVHRPTIDEMFRQSQGVLAWLQRN